MWFAVSHLTPFDGFLKCVKARSNKEKESAIFWLKSAAWHWIGWGFWKEEAAEASRIPLVLVTSSVAEEG